MFCWVARLHKILSMDQLRRRDFIVVNGCPFCLQDKETATHLLVHCNYAHTVWVSILRMFDMCWVMPCSIKEFFEQWVFRGKSVRGHILWRLSLYAGLWKLWIERNNRFFQNKCKRPEVIVRSVVWVFSEWVIRKAEFLGVSLEALNRSWPAHFQGGRRSILRQKLLWEPPLNGFLKLNFDGSYFPHIQMGGIGVLFMTSLEKL